ncbi:MAG: histidine kinase [Aeromicrobium sp.]
MQPVDYQPHLSRWSKTWRAVAVVVIGGLGWAQFAPWQWHHNRLWFFADIGLGVLAFGLVFWRRRFPVQIALITAVASGISSAAGGPATLALVSMATRRRWREIVPVSIVSLMGSLWLAHIDPSPEDSWIVVNTAIVSIIGVTVGWGLYIGSRRELLATLRDRADKAESDQSRRAEQARTAERGRIAREMHDVLAHRISLVSMHAGALSYRTDLTDEEIRRTAAIIQENSHQAMTELREVLGVLRDGPGDAAPELPQPAANDIGALIAEARDWGMKIDYASDADIAWLPDSAGRALYRIIQEALTNVRKHAQDTLVTVRLSGGREDGLSINIRNPLRIGDVRIGAPESGLGLIGLTERTALLGGTLSHDITPDHQFILRAWLPWPA